MARLDQALVQAGLAPSRTKAQQLIAAGEVEIEIAAGDWRVAHSASQIARGALRLKPDSKTLKYVSRGGLKMEFALEHLGLSVQGARALDVGLSTGGFSDCLLQQGAASIVGVDVGHGQLAALLKTDPRLKSFEGVNVRELDKYDEVLAALAGGLDLVVVDVSFISLQQVLPVLGSLLSKDCRLLALVKPQFEVGAAHLDKNGIVRDSRLYADVQTQILQALEKCGFSSVEYFACALKGQDGNQEFFVLANRI